jgi:DNA-binding MarR family transcriptional regulator
MDIEALYYVTRRLRQYVEGAMSAPSSGHGGPLYRRLVVEDVLAHPSASVQEIAERLSLAQSLVSRAVAHARAEGVLETHTDERDHRRTRVVPSASAARSTRTAGERDAAELLAPLLSGLPEADQDAFFRALDHMQETFKRREGGA